MNTLISVIVPIYKVEKYLDRCVASLVSQSYESLEIILVDDGSPDACPEMCDAWAEKDCRIKVIHKENGGLSDARNSGLSVAQGEYVAFVDSDDWLNCDYISVMYSAILSNGADIAECKYIKTHGEEPVAFVDGNVGVTVCTSEEAMEHHLKGRMFHTVVWNKLYSRDIIVCPFEKGKYNEDEFWSYKVISAAKKAVSVDAALYYYFQRDDSIMGNTYSPKRLDSIEAMEQRAAFAGDHYPALYDLAKDNLLRACVYHGQLAIKHLKRVERKQAVSLLKETYRAHTLSAEYKKSLSASERLWLKIGRFSFVLMCRMRNILGIGV